MYDDDEISAWDDTLMDGLDDEPFEIDIISMDESLPEIETVVIDEPTIGIADTINKTSSTVGGKGPLYAYRTNVSPEDKNRSNNLD